ncbi:hypothetical protein BBOV_II007650 [Babesia bovis T2Bo]|uniref:Uncharacterized protein n=1 Tax=Babesia bovis TaxID=5865 RepID=A7AUV4_BABBO|nr:hypothetical protein BBOV_II007650 [Babesia bovis T2Bo]EDO06715.1 hypothetical protein BBOV_II007650 [Babesia bovis T2Bo]|eukprot:XP_001610283.1 hypothetical protein [Babesia bovis T2Bo]
MGTVDDTSKHRDETTKCCPLHTTRDMNNGNNSDDAYLFEKATDSNVQTIENTIDKLMDERNMANVLEDGIIQSTMENTKEQNFILTKYAGSLRPVEDQTVVSYNNHDIDSQLVLSFDQETAMASNEWLAAWSLNSLMDSSQNISKPKQSTTTTGTQSAVKIIDYKLERSERIINVLKMQLAERDEIIARMVKHVDMLEEWKSELDRGQRALAIEQNHELGATINVIQEKYEHSQMECITLNNKLLEMERTQMQKDDEIKQHMQECESYKSRIAQLEMQLEATTAERQSFSISMQKLKQTFDEKLMETKVALDKEYQKQIVYLIGQIDALKKQIIQKDSDIEQKNSHLCKMEKQCNALSAQIDGYKSTIRDQEMEIRTMRDTMLDMEEQIFKNEQNASARISAALAVLEGTRNDNVELKNKNKILQKELDKCRIQLSTISARDADR